MKQLIAALLLIIITSISCSAQTNWKLEKDKDGIKVWTRKQTNSNLKEYKASTIVNTSIDKLVTFFKNYKLYEKWMYKIDAGSLKILKKYNDNEFVVRATMSAPFIKTRESITHFTINQPDNKGIVMINLVTEPDFIPLNSNYVRIPKMNGYWKLIPTENGKVEISHVSTVNAGGSIPEAIANLGAVDAPFSMLQKIKEFNQ
jgi:hypothetical protein